MLAEQFRYFVLGFPADFMKFKIIFKGTQRGASQRMRDGTLSKIAGEGTGEFKMNLYILSLGISANLIPHVILWKI